MESNRGVFIFGEKDVAQHITRYLASLNFLSSMSTSQVFEERDAFHIIIAPCNLSKKQDLIILTRLFKRLKNPNMLKTIYSLDPEPVSFEQVMFGLSLGADYVASGEQKDMNLKNYLKRTSLNMGEDASMNKLSEILDKAVRESNRDKIKQIYSKLSQLDKENSLILKMKAQACKAMGKNGKAPFFIKKMLEINPQDLWAASALGKAFMQESQHQKALDVLLETSEIYGDYHPTDTVDRSKMECLQMKIDGKPSKDITDFLSTRGTLSYMDEQFEEANYFFSLGSMLSNHDPVEKAKLLFHHGQSLLKQENYWQAKEVWEESAKLGGAKYNRAIKCLQQLQPILAKIPPKGSPVKTSAPDQENDQELSSEQDESLIETEIY